jgi:hypothetical protein
MRVKMGIVLMACFCCSSLVSAQQLEIHAQKGQTKQEMDRDKFHCYSQAKSQTGFDPSQPLPITAPPVQEQTKGGPRHGAAGGAAVGLGVGSLISDAGKGAAVGATHGALMGGVRRHKQQAAEDKKQQQWSREQGDRVEEKHHEYNRAFAACLESRGYTVK